MVLLSWKAGALAGAAASRAKEQRLPGGCWSTAFMKGAASQRLSLERKREPWPLWRRFKGSGFRRGNWTLLNQPAREAIDSLRRQLCLRTELRDLGLVPGSPGQRPPEARGADSGGGSCDQRPSLVTQPAPVAVRSPLRVLARPSGGALRTKRRPAPTPSVGQDSSAAARASWPGRGHGVHGGSGHRLSVRLGDAERSSPAATYSFCSHSRAAFSSRGVSGAASTAHIPSSWRLGVLPWLGRPGDRRWRDAARRAVVLPVGIAWRSSHPPR
jgi:hypothetical protein